MASSSYITTVFLCKNNLRCSSLIVPRHAPYRVAISKILKKDIHDDGRNCAASSETIATDGKLYRPSNYQMPHPPLERQSTPASAITVGYSGS